MRVLGSDVTQGVVGRSPTFAFWLTVGTLLVRVGYYRLTINCVTIVGISGYCNNKVSVSFTNGLKRPRPDGSLPGISQDQYSSTR